MGYFPQAARALMNSFSTSNINHDTFKSVGSPVPRWRRKPQEDRTMKSIIRKDEAAVSPVIATILMVAITVVLAAVLDRKGTRLNSSHVRRSHAVVCFN